MSSYDLVLAHHGMKGQKHGVRNAEWYPIDAYRKHLKNSGYNKEQIDKITDKINTTSDSKLGNWAVKREIKKQTKAKNKIAEQRRAQSKANLEKARAAKNTSDQNDTVKEAITAESKKNAIDRGDLKYVRDHASQFTTNEINDAINKNAVMQKINDLTNDQVNAGKRKVKQMQDTLGTVQDITGKVRNIASNSLGMYNTAKAFQKVINDNKKQTTTK